MKKETEHFKVIKYILLFYCLYIFNVENFKNTVINKSMQNFRKMFKQLTDREEKKNKTNEKQEQTENKKWQS